MLFTRNLFMQLMLISAMFGMFTGVQRANAFCTVSTCGYLHSCSNVTGCDYGSCVSVWCLDTEGCPNPASPGYQCNWFGCTFVSSCG